MNSYTGKIVRKEMQKPNIGILKFRLNEPIDFKPGQFMNIHITKEKMRPFSITSTPTNNELEFYIKAHSDGFVAREILKIEEGDELLIKGPYGFFTLQDTNNEIYFVCAGSGVAPLISMSRHLQEHGSERKRTFLQGASHANELGFHDELLEMAKKDDFEYIPTISRPADNPDWEGETGRVEELLKYCTNKDAEVYVCGPPPMVDNVLEELQSIGFDREQIMIEKYY